MNMMFQDKVFVTQIILGVFSAWFLIRFFYGLYKKKNEIIVSVGGCKECPFKNEWSTDKYNCNLKKIVGINNLSHTNFEDLKKHCPINGKLEISVSKS